MRRDATGKLALAVVFLLGCAEAGRAESQAVATGKPTPVPMAHVDRKPASEPVEVLQMRLSDPDPAVRAAAAWELADIENPSAELVAQLRALRDDPDRNVRYAAIWADLPPDPAGHALSCTRPRRKYFAPPHYPVAAFKAKIQGSVRLRLLVGELGEVAHAEVIESIPELDEAALESVRHWQFEPGTCDGRPTAMIVTTPLTFRIR